ncbi:TPA: putative DNA binding domain-containing protein [Enterobacter cloacae]|uniref:RNA-binding domain-containing protein n=1 Tax=Enterobacter cloacae TaxID=550 RepID=UPI0021D328B1|nr:RNA-binding domain-containing protein [Enterobacter cloacae]MCU6251985.1 putative DNA binding domain-containing protein [Enterobacter cloacae]HEG1829602.1 putative DNA binding domain-containing protein [Enterobacter cloacae]
MNNTHNITELKMQIASCIKKGASAPDVINYIYSNNSIASKESMLWDYKSDLEADEANLAKIIKSIVSFYNSHGGYIIYGITELKKDKEFGFIDFDINKINVAQLRSLLSVYSDSIIDITFSTCKINHLGQEFDIGTIHIPQRQFNTPPAKFIRDCRRKSGNENNNKYIFKENDVYFRTLDQNKKAELREEWQFLYSSREIAFTNDPKIQVSIDHNLPEKKIICPDFVGREVILSSLWEWLSDPLEYTKVLAGDGGKGKTSIAYTFCQQFLESPSLGFERVLWISAKSSQFSGMQNDYFDLQDPDFTDYNSFLLTLCDQCALNVEELESTSQQNIKIKLKQSLPIFPSLIIVDNVDSLEQSEQLKIVDACRQFGQGSVRFLITTRNRFSYSDELCIEIGGLERDDYEIFINESVIKYGIKAPNRKQLDSIYNATDGSPLLTQSIIRLCKLGENFDTAVSDWKGEAGEDARNAAVLREISSLSFDAKRVILSIFYFDSCSKSELQQACSLGKTKLNDAIIELQSLFLVNAPKFIANEDRFSLSMTTKLIINDIQSKLASDYNKLKFEIQKLRKGLNTSGKKGNIKRTGLAISQALALMKEGQDDLAISTITTELQRQPNNPDLLLAHARCLLQAQKPDMEKARTILRSAFEQGQEKEMLFELWYNCENSLSSISGQIEVATLAMKKEAFLNSKWAYLLANSLVLRASLRNGIDKIKDLVEASLYLSKAIKDSKNKEKEKQKLESNELHSIIWRHLENDTSVSWLESFDFMIELINHGDKRSFIFKNAHRCIIEAESESKNQRQKTAIEKRKNIFNRAINELTIMNKNIEPLIFN